GSLTGPIATFRWRSGGGGSDRLGRPGANTGTLLGSHDAPCTPCRLAIRSGSASCIRWLADVLSARRLACCAANRGDRSTAWLLRPAPDHKGVRCRGLRAQVGVDCEAVFACRAFIGGAYMAASPCLQHSPV